MPSSPITFVGHSLAFRGAEGDPGGIRSSPSASTPQSRVIRGPGRQLANRQDPVDDASEHDQASKRRAAAVAELPLAR